ncbi:MAG TPA: TIGR02530 family flagellar biosynthesis protein [Symbiobacteriaceae bacterium]|nr:TIGR02530 family flagellar biosynthesis protein [Symbiobacteriaceae bacterium]
MTNRIFIGPRPVGPGGQPGRIQPSGPQTTPPSGTFQKLLDSALTQPVKLSGHAQERLNASNKPLSEAEMKDLAGAVDRAAQKGARDALILMRDRDLALVVSVKNRTVITAVDGDRVKENIFTNIDSAVIL